MIESARQTRVAILVACHNDGPTLAESVASLRGEPESELVVIDDGSTDPNTLEELAALEDHGVRVIRQTQSGPSEAWMTGLNATSAPYVLPFSSDDLLYPGATTVLADALDEAPEAAFAWGDMKSFGSASAYIPSAPALCPWHVTFVNSRSGYALFRRDSLLQAGGWQLEWGIEDWDLWMRLASRGSAGVHVPRLTFHYRRDSGGRFRRHARVFDAAYGELRERNSELFARRRETRHLSPAPKVLKIAFPLIDRLPLVSRLFKVQVCDALTLLFWSAGPRRTFRIIVQGILFRARLLFRA
jgi:glycosyltransferase involved in cell wall biosynthesis